MRWLMRLFGWKNRQFETLTEVESDGFKIRIWRSAPTLQHALEFDHDTFALSVLDFTEATTPTEWYTELMHLPHVSWVAITKASGCGISCYQDWH